MTTGEEGKIDYQRLVKSIHNYLQDYNIHGLISKIGYTLMEYKIYFNVEPSDIVLAYYDHYFMSIIVTIVLKYGVAIKVKIQADEGQKYVAGVDVWYVIE
jgi:hypothetical protein